MGLVAVVMTAPIDVILPTFNGALYLREQVASIAQQTLRPARLLLRDDGSSDGTCQIIRELAEEYGAWIEILPAQGNLGMCRQCELFAGGHVSSLCRFG